MSETKLKQKVIKYIKKEYPGAWIYKTCDRFTVGIPDLILCIYGRFIAIELKVGNNKPTPMQIRNIKKILAAGGVADTAWSLDEVKDLLRKEVKK